MDPSIQEVFLRSQEQQQQQCDAVRVLTGRECRGAFLSVLKILLPHRIDLGYADVI